MKPVWEVWAPWALLDDDTPDGIVARFNTQAEAFAYVRREDCADCQRAMEVRCKEDGA